MFWKNFYSGQRFENFTRFEIFTRFENKSVPSLLAGEFLRYHRSIFSQHRYVDTGCKNKPDVSYLVYLSTSLYRGNSGVEKAEVILLVILLIYLGLLASKAPHCLIVIFAIKWC